MGKYVGIDLGTTYSVVAYIDESGIPRILQNGEGDNLTPSAILFTKDGVVVGDAAKSESFIDSANYVELVKRYMGDRTFERRAPDGMKYTPESLSAIILKKLKQDAEKSLGDSIDGAVITVPAYFNDSQRKATKDAAQIAGLNPLAIINEPTAAALSYGIDKGDENKKIVAIYDLGGGTFDICIMSFQGTQIETLASVGNPQLGGCDFDATIVEYVKDKAKEQGISIDEDVDAMQNLRLDAEKAKKQLSQKTQTKISLTVNGKRFAVEIARETFEKLIQPLIFRTVVLFEEALDMANITRSDLNKILLVGGSTRIPLVSAMIREDTGITPSSDIHPDEAVAIGAAYHVVNLLKKKQAEGTVSVSNADIPDLKKEYRFTDRTAHSIGVIQYDEEKDDLVNSIILKCNTPIPAQHENVYATLTPNQKTIDLEVTQGESEDLAYVTKIGKCEIPLKVRPYCYPVRIIVSCDEDSIIHVRVIDDEDNEDLGDLHINRLNNLSESEMDTQKTRVGKLNIGE